MLTESRNNNSTKTKGDGTGMKYAYDDATFKSVNEQLKKNNPSGNTELDAFPGSVLLFSKARRGDFGTTECKELLREYDEELHYDNDWKRIWKKSFQTDSDESQTYRGFQSKATGKIVTVYATRWAAFIYDFNLKDAFGEIEQLVSFIRKHYIGCDYTGIMYNPVTKTVWMTMGDGGSIAVEDISKLPLDDDDAMCEMLEDEFDPKFHPDNALDFVTETLYSDEFNPKAAHGYVPVGYYKEFG